jgi:hypothetical protein
MCVFHSSQFTFMTRNQAAQPPNIIVDTKSGGNSVGVVSQVCYYPKKNFKLGHSPRVRTVDLVLPSRIFFAGSAA